MNNPVLRVSGLSIGIGRGASRRTLVHDISFAIAPGTCLGILGESGSGKSLTCKAVLGLLDRAFSVEGSVFFAGQDLLSAGAETLRLLRGGSLAAVLQNPMTSFNPLMRIGPHFMETLKAHGRGSVSENRAASVAALERMGFADPLRVFGSFPNELSGGMLQRAMIALALINRPRLIIADEPTTALDTVSRAQILGEFRRIRRESDCALLFVSHDLGALEAISDTILVMHGGVVVERGALDRVRAESRDPCARMLLDTRAALMARFSLSARGYPDQERSRVGA